MADGNIRPNLFIIGAAKCGTTTLHSYLNAHSDIFMSNPKEPGFFVPEFKHNPKDLSWYLDLFKEASSHRYVGESSTHYTKRPLYEGVAERIYKFSPDSRLIYLVRDPIDRAISHYWHNTKSLRKEFNESRPMLTAIKEDEQYREYGDYAMQLEPWINLFGSNKLYIMVFEEMINNPEKEIAQLLSWLDLQPSYDSSAFEKHNFRTGSFTRPQGKGIINDFRHSAFWNVLSKIVPKGAKKWARGYAEETVTITLPDMRCDVVEHLLPWATKRVVDTEKLLGRELPMWETSRGKAKVDL